MHAILRQLRRAAFLAVSDGPSDAQLLESFLGRRDEAAFEALVRRHGPMVLGVCRRVAGNVHDADDAFQATFLVFVRKAASLRSWDLLPGWLYGVAYRTALNTRAMARKRRKKERQAAQQPSPGQEREDGAPEELLARLDTELNRLPDRYRLPVVLCELQGHSRRQAAELLGLPVGTVSWRLAHARKLLARRLARYGSMLSAGALAGVFSESAASAVPAALVRAVKLQTLLTGKVAPPVQALTEGVLKAMLLSKLKVVWGVTLAVVLGGASVELMYRPALAADPNQQALPGATARGTEDELEELRLEIAALRKGLQATRERVKTLEDQLATVQAGSPGTAGGTWAKAKRAEMWPEVDTTPKNGGASVPHADTGRPAEGLFRVPADALGKPAGGGGFFRRRPGETAKPRGDRSESSDLPSGRMPEKATDSAATDEGRKNAGGGPVDLETSERKQLLEFYRRAFGVLTKGDTDPLVAARAALKQLRKQPNDPNAVDQLDRALKQLEALRQRNPPSKY